MDNGRVFHMYTSLIWMTVVGWSKILISAIYLGLKNTEKKKQAKYFLAWQQESKKEAEKSQDSLEQQHFCMFISFVCMFFISSVK